MASLIESPLCLDGRMLGVKATGVGRYADTLRLTLRQAGVDPWVLDAVGPSRGPLWRWFHAPALQPRWAPRRGDEGVLAGPADLFKEAQIYFDLYRRLMPVATDAPPGIMHWTYPVPLFMKGWKNIYTVHDAIPLNQPSLTPIDAHRHGRLLAAIAKRATLLLTVSESARLEIIDALGCDPALVVAVPQGVEAPDAEGSPPQGLAPDSFYLFCGAIEPRKNLVRLIEAHAASGSVRRLVIAGPDGWRAPDILAKIAKYPNVMRLPYQTRQDLGALIRGARAVLFPSLAEGFGLPVIEAMLAGTPVMTSDLPALRETAGGAALLVDPQDVAAMAAAIGRLDRDDVLAADLIAAGRKRSEAFSLPQYAARLAPVYANLMEHER